MAITPIVVTWGGAAGLVYPDGSGPPNGGVRFQLAAGTFPGVATDLTDSVTGETVKAIPVQGQVLNGRLLGSAASNPALTLFANDDPDSLPVGTYYIVTEQLGAGNLDPWQLVVHFDAVDGVVDLSSQRPTP